MHAFLITFEWEDRGGHTLRFFGRSPEIGPVEIRITGVSPVFFVDRSTELGGDIPIRQRRELELKSVYGSPVDALYFDTERDLRLARDRLRARNIKTHEGDINPCDRFLMERFIQGGVRIQGASHVEKGRTVFLNPALAPQAVETELRLASLDIEIGATSGELYSIAVHCTGAGPEERIVFVARSDGQSIQIDSTNVLLFQNEKLLLEEFVRWMQDRDPDIIIGWNVVSFDLDFLIRRAETLGVRFAIARTNRLPSIRRREGFSDFASVPGRVVIDGPVALRSAFYNFEDFSLDAVASELLGRRKLIQSKASEKIQEIDRLFREDLRGLALYNLEDCVLVSEIFGHTGLVQLSMRRTEISGMLLDRIGRSSGAFDYFFLPRLHRRGFVALDTDDVEYAAPAPGGYVMEPQSGLYDHVIVLDFRSLYPSIMQTFCIDPYSLLCNEKDPLETPDGYRFSRTHNILPDFIGELMEKRALAKRENDPYLSMAIKILMNSFYGVMGSPGCRHYRSELPTAITRTGQWLLLQSKAELERRGFIVLYGDTDSLFVKLCDEDVPDPHSRGVELAGSMNDFWEQRLREEFEVETYLMLQFEKYYRRFFLPPARGGGAAKKRYVGLLERDGVEAELHFVGMEIVRSDWTALAKRFQRELYKRVFAQEEVEDWIIAFVKQLRAGGFDDQLVYRKRLRKSIRDYTKNIPQHVRAAQMLDRPVRTVRYVITPEGPVPVELEPRRLDYEYYLEHQLKPVADTVLGFLDTSFDEIVRSTQLKLF